MLAKQEHVFISGCYSFMAGVFQTNALFANNKQIKGPSINAFFFQRDSGVSRRARTPERHLVLMYAIYAAVLGFWLHASSNLLL